MKKSLWAVAECVILGITLCFGTSCSNGVDMVEETDSVEEICLCEEEPSRSVHGISREGTEGSNFRGGRQGGGNSSRGSRVGRRGRGW